MNEYNGMKIGDIITCYWKGYYLLVEIKDRGIDNSPLFSFTKVADFNGKLCKSKKIMQCDGAYCKLAFEHMKALIEKKKTEIVNLEKLIALYY